MVKSTASLIGLFCLTMVAALPVYIDNMESIAPIDNNFTCLEAASAIEKFEYITDLLEIEKRIAYINATITNCIIDGNLKHSQNDTRTHDVIVDAGAFYEKLIEKKLELMAIEVDMFSYLIQDVINGKESDREDFIDRLLAWIEAEDDMNGTQGMR